MGKKRGSKARPHYEPTGNGKWGGKNLSSMRETAFGVETSVEIHRTLERAERMRDDEGLQKAAAEKRARKAAKRKAAA